MAVTDEILRTYRAPRRVMRRLLSDGPREDRGVAYLLAACVIIFVGQWPRLQRAATLDPEAPPFDAQIAGALFAWLFVAPLVFYGLAALSHLAARAVGGQGSWWGARIALFWTLLAVSPLLLLNGLVAGFVGPGAGLTFVGLASGLAFLSLWGISLAEAEKPPEAREG